MFNASLGIGKKLGITFMNSIDPYRMEGYKLTAFEIFLQLGRRAPRTVIVPLSSGGHLLGLMRGFADLEREGLIAAYPQIVGVQAESCAPLARAFEQGLADVRTAGPRADHRPRHRQPHAAGREHRPAPDPGTRRAHHRRSRTTTMLEAQRELAAGEGLFGQPESAATLAALKRLAAAGRIRAGDGAVVLVLTGSGLKSLHLLMAAPVEVHRLALDGLEAGLSRLARPA